jgi:hypothetical protein
MKLYWSSFWRVKWVYLDGKKRPMGTFKFAGLHIVWQHNFTFITILFWTLRLNRKYCKE